MDLMQVVVWIFFGGIAGWIASIIMGRNKKINGIANVIYGIVGAFLGGAIMNYFGYQGVNGFNFWSLLVAVLGAVVLIFVVGLLTNK